MSRRGLLDAVIVGAGPVGAALAHRNVPFSFVALKVAPPGTLLAVRVTVSLSVGVPHVATFAAHQLCK